MSRSGMHAALIDEDVGFPSDPVPCPICGDLVEREFKCRRVLAKELTDAEIDAEAIRSLAEDRTRDHEGELMEVVDMAKVTAGLITALEHRIDQYRRGVLGDPDSIELLAHQITMAIWQERD